MPTPAHGRARRLAETSLLAAIAVVLHMADLLLTMGVVGPLLCALPHAMATLRHGLGAGALTGLTSTCLLFFTGGPLEAAYHGGLFAVTGLMVGRAMRGDVRGAAAMVEGTVVVGLGAGAVTTALLEIMGVDEAGKLIPDFMVDGMDWVAGPVLALGEGNPLLPHLPGLAPPAARAAFVEDLVRLPGALFLAMGAVFFAFTWLVAVAVFRRTGIEGVAPSMPGRARLPPWVAILGIAAIAAGPRGPAWARTLQANVVMGVEVAAYAVGYLTIVSWSRGKPMRGLGGMILTLPLYYVTIWIGWMTALQPPLTQEEWDAPSPFELARADAERMRAARDEAIRAARAMDQAEAQARADDPDAAPPPASPEGERVRVLAPPGAAADPGPGEAPASSDPPGLSRRERRARKRRRKSGKGAGR